MGFISRIPQLWRYFAVTVFSLAVSVASVVWAVLARSSGLGGLGGALGTAAAFASLFLRPDYGLKIYEVINDEISSELPKVDQLEQRLNALVTALQINSNGQFFQNLAIALASIIGTLFWAFGEYIAKSIIGT